MPRFRHRSTSCGSYHDHHQQQQQHHTNNSFTSSSTTTAADEQQRQQQNLEITKSVFSAAINHNLYSSNNNNSSSNNNNSSGKCFLHMTSNSRSFNLSMAYAMLERARCLDILVAKSSTSKSSSATTTAAAATSSDTIISFQRQCLLRSEMESGYTPLHSAIINRNLCAMLLFLRHATNTMMNDMDIATMNNHHHRLVQKPMTILEAKIIKKKSNNNSSSSGSCSSLQTSPSSTITLIQQMVTATDKEGLTPLDLLGKLQRFELEQCRKRLLLSQKQRPKIITSTTNLNNIIRPRQSSFDITATQEEEQEQQQHDDDLELGIFNAAASFLESSSNNNNNNNNDGRSTRDGGDCSYACEVVTFGRPNLCALGVISSSDSGKTPSSSSSSLSSSTSILPQRVQEFAQDTVGRDRSAVAVAASTHHTLVALKNGHLYAFGLGKGGRLGLDTEIQQCPLPRRVLGPLNRRKVVGIGAAENHSLCVTKDGSVFAWGSNRFGQLGWTETKVSPSPTTTTSPSNTGSSSTSPNFRCLPRRVEDLRNIPCIAVATGLKHSVALSRKGEVYVWGDNTSGQLGIPRRTGIQKVQRVEALWTRNNNSAPKTAIAISAAEQSTIVLTNPIPGLTHVNSVYEWGHGNYVPIRVHFDNNSNNNSRVGGNNGNGQQKEESSSSLLSSRTSRVVNPVAIACAKYHNAAITSDGHVYTWGLHAESLGRTASTKRQQQNYNKNNTSTSGRSTSLPQLVTGMLPENGGGVAIALSAADQHTAVITDCGALFTWGTTDGNNVLGHEGVRWQPSPKRVPGVHRAVDVALAKEHTVLLIGSSFPRIPNPKGLESLDVLAARQVAKHVDLFNVIPILIMAERTESPLLVQYCKEFIRRNLDGVLNVGKKSVMNQYLNDMLADSLHDPDKEYRDDHHHPFITDALSAGNHQRPSFDREWLSGTQDWLQGCKELSETPLVQKLLATAVLNKIEFDEFYSSTSYKRTRRSSSITSEQGEFGPNGDSKSPLTTSKAGRLDYCIKKTANMDLSTTDSARENSVWLGKEIRGVRKKLNQIKKLEASEELIVLSTEQQAKVDRRPALEAELGVYETALEEVEKRIKELVLEGQKQQQAKKMATKDTEKATKPNSNDEKLDDKSENKDFEKAEEEKMADIKSFSCNICGIKCPDETSFELHRNGRKHRNRVAQAAEDEKTKVAASIMEQRQLEQFKGPSPPAVAKQMKAKNAWAVSSPQPRLTLPPPPHPVVPQVVPFTQSPWKAEPSKLSTVQPSPFSTPTKASPPKPSQTSDFLKVTKKETARAKAITPKVLKLSPGSPIWHSSPDSTRCVPLNVYSAPDLVAPAPSQSSFSLADFLAPKPVPKSSKSPKTWSSPKAEKMGAPQKIKTFAEIQAEEVDFKSRQDKTYEKGGGTWFIERRQRANSLREIQISAQREQEERELIEEQKRIEEQIQKELTMQQQRNQNNGSNNKKKSQATTARRKQNKKTNNKPLNNSKASNGISNTDCKTSIPSPVTKARKNTNKPKNNRNNKGGKKSGATNTRNKMHQNSTSSSPLSKCN